MTTPDLLSTAQAAHRRVLAAEAKAKPARIERDAAVVAAFEAGVKPPMIHRATGVGLSLVRKILRDAGVAPRSTDPRPTGVDNPKAARRG